MAKQFSRVAHGLRNLSLATFVAALAAGCGGGTSPGSQGSPAAPSPAANAPTAGGATVTGTVAVGVSTSAWATAGAGMTVSVDGTSLSTAVDGSGAFTLSGVPTGRVTLHFSGNGADARLDVDNVTERETIELHVHVSGSQVDIDDDHRETPDHRLELEGPIAEINLAARTLRIRDTTVTVPDGTPIHHGGTPIDFKSLVVNDRVHIHATPTGPTTASAQDVEVQTDKPGQAPGSGNGNDNPGDHHDDGSEAEASGTVAGRTGACPAITFAVGTTMITANAATQFHDTTCSALANGDRVEVSGTRQSATAILAKQIEKKK